MLVEELLLLPIEVLLIRVRCWLISSGSFIVLVPSGARAVVLIFVTGRNSI